MFFVLLAGLCFCAAALSLPLPLPLGFLFFLTGVSLLLLASPPMQRRFAALRARYPAFDSRLRGIERYLPAFIREGLNGARPSQATKSPPGGRGSSSDRP
ncbi:MAG: hypothetical protein D6773_05490 [Alphaproteobacteria bacterium]|nr:MAG: hypothetical protein D6773_05490 [Alphaproteobacteria bacterium]